MKNILMTLMVLGSVPAFANPCNQALVQKQLDDVIIGETLNNLNAIRVRAEARGDRALADKMNLRTMEIHLAIFSLADKVCSRP